MTELLIFLLLFWWFTQIFYKLTLLDQEDCPIKHFICRMKQKRLGNFLDKLVNCELCVESHLGLTISLVISYYHQDYSYCLWGYAGAGFNNIIKRLEQNVLQ